MSDSRHRTYTWLVAVMVVCYFLPVFIRRNWSVLIFYGTFFLLALVYGVVRSEDRQRRMAIQRNGIQLEAEVVGHYEARARKGSDLAKARQMLRSVEDPLELEIRYTFGDREIVSRGRVSSKTYFQTRGLKMLKVKVSPERPEEWVEAA